MEEFTVHGEYFVDSGDLSLVKMLVIFENGERHLFNFKMLEKNGKMSIVHVLKSLNIKLTTNNRINCIAQTGGEVNYIVSINGNKDDDNRKDGAESFVIKSSVLKKLHNQPKLQPYNVPAAKKEKFYNSSDHIQIEKVPQQIPTNHQHESSVKAIQEMPASLNLAAEAITRTRIMLILTSSMEPYLIPFRIREKILTVRNMRKLLKEIIPDPRLIRCIVDPCEGIDYALFVNCIVEQSKLLETVAAALDLPEIQKLLNVFQKKHPRKYKSGFVAACNSCQYVGYNFASCDHCLFVFTSEPEAMQMPETTTKVIHTKSKTSE